jgi:CMP-N-acetylneuraminic acid synthetase
MTRNIAIIPARGGSKRLPRKNILPFLGRPIIEYTIEAAKKSGIFETITVSTEDNEIRNTIANLGCEIHQRRLDLASDTTRVVEVLRDVLTYYSNGGKEFDYLCCLYATAPLRNASDIKKAYQLMMSKRADYCLGVTEYEFSPFFAFNLKEDGFIERRWPELAMLPSWEKPKAVADNGSMYWVKVSEFTKTYELEGKNAIGYVMPRWKSVDIDTQEDFSLAEFFAKNHYYKE